MRNFEFLICILISLPGQNIVYDIFIILFLMGYYYYHFILCGIIAILIMIVTCNYIGDCLSSNFHPRFDSNQNIIFENDLNENNINNSNSNIEDNNL